MVKILLICIFGVLNLLPAFAQSTPPAATPSSEASDGNTPTADKQNQQDADTGGVGTVIREIGGKTALPSYDAGHAKQSYQPGASQITSVIYFILDFFKYIFGGIAVLMMVISGIKLIVAGRAVQDVTSRQKENFRFALTGLIIILIADELIRNVFFGEAGEVFRSGTDMQMAGEAGSNLGRGVAGIFRIFVPAVAILYVVIAGIRVLLSMGDPEKLKKAKTQITWAVVGIIIAGLTEVVVFRVLFPDDGGRLPDTAEFTRWVITITNWISGFISTIAVSMLIYAGYLYVTSFGGAGIDKAKTIVKGAIIGLLIAMAAFGLVNTFLKVEPLTGIPTPQEVAIPNT